MSKKDNKEEQVVERKERAKYITLKKSKWWKMEVKLSKGEVAIKLFNTQKKQLKKPNAYLNQ